MAKQKFIDAVRGKRTENAPWVPYAGVHCAFLINEPADKYLQDPELLAKGLVETAKKYKAPAAGGYFSVPNLDQFRAGK